jgi:FtsZ-interacting cell division protein ZipA
VTKPKNVSGGKGLDSFICASELLKKQQPTASQQTVKPAAAVAATVQSAVDPSPADRAAAAKVDVVCMFACAKEDHPFISSGRICSVDRIYCGNSVCTKREVFKDCPTRIRALRERS